LECDEHPAFAKKPVIPFVVLYLYESRFSAMARRVARGGAMGTIVPPHNSPVPKVALTIFRLIKLLMCKPKKNVSANQRNYLKKTILLQLLVEPD